VLGHEIVHNVFDDVSTIHAHKNATTILMDDGTELPLDHRRLQQAMDYRINALLVESKIGKMPKQGCFDLKIADSKTGVREVYKRLYEDDPEGEKLGPDGFDVILSPGASTGQNAQSAASARNPQQWAVEVATAQALEKASRGRGDLPGGMTRMFDEILKPKVPWTEKIRTEINRRVGSGSLNWRKPDRRFIGRDLWLPGKTGFGAGWIVVWGDTSGSVDDSEMNRGMTELSSIIEDVRPRRLTVLWCDAAIHRVDDLEEGSDLANAKREGVGGRGGTSCEPVFEWITEQQQLPDMLLCFTDGEVCFPEHAPAFPVIWCTYRDNEDAFPWGEVVRVDDGVADA
jgi:predicted metal-dependent peptidase